MTEHDLSAIRHGDDELAAPIVIIYKAILGRCSARRPVKVAAIAYANKIIRMVWAMMVRGELYREPVAIAA